MCPGVWLLLLGAVCAGVRGAQEPQETRQVYLQFNPGSSDSSVNLLHIRAVGKGNTIHYVWSSIGVPTVLLIYTESEQSQLQVNWTRLLSPEPYGAITIEPQDSVRYSTALLFTRIFEYNDINNTADFASTANKYFYAPYNLSDFVWENVNETLNASAMTAHITGVNATDPNRNFQNGSVTFKVTAFGGPGRDNSSPRLLYTANSTKLEFMISGVQPRGNNSRFALEMVTLERKEGRKKIQSVRTIDDEYTPTIFEMVELVPDWSNHSHAKGFFQWKSVAYGSSNGTRADALPCQMYKPRLVNGTLGLQSIAHAFYGKDLQERYNIEAYNVSFGIADGDFYNKHSYLGWSALIGYGSPPRDSFSILVICIMAVALGTPVVLLLVGAIVVSIMKRRVFSNYEPIN